MPFTNFMVLLAFIIFLVTALQTPIAEAGDEPANDWENPAIFQRNKEAPRCTSIPFGDKTAALSSDASRSPFVKSLNGTWAFHWVDRPANRPKDFEKPGFDASGWADIPVPSDWQFEGYDRPIYVNIPYTFPPDPPRIPHDHNPVGSYRRTFTLPEAWDGREIYIHFGGVNSALYLWINGEAVGYSQGSKTPAEFRITPYLKPGENLVAAQVYRYCDGSYLECQDFWRLSGIERDVCLFSVPKVHVRDFFVRAGLEEGGRRGIPSGRGDLAGSEGR